jgi:hypothetical protein
MSAEEPLVRLTQPIAATSLLEATTRMADKLDHAVEHGGEVELVGLYQRGNPQASGVEVMAVYRREDFNMGGYVVATVSGDLVVGGRVSWRFGQ